MAKYAAAEASIACVDQAVQTHGGNGLAHEYGLGNLLIGGARGSHRSGEPRDDPELRRAVLPRPAEELLMPVNYAVERGIATITLDNPEQPQRIVEVAGRRGGPHLSAAAADYAVRAVVLTHTGRTFCAGADLKEQAAERRGRGTRRMLALLRAIVDMPKPVIARVDGHVRACGSAWSVRATWRWPDRSPPSPSPRCASGWRRRSSRSPR